ncbi:MAG: hypothetical protein LBN18_00010 [Dysgonamonadaceae bacterium]|jgi:hypothetical protein|nr:hypothetical protein [Dysgonamonadaceae bacterium]
MKSYKKAGWICLVGLLLSTGVWANTSLIRQRKSGLENKNVFSQSKFVDTFAENSPFGNGDEGQLRNTFDPNGEIQVGELPSPVGSGEKIVLVLGVMYLLGVFVQQIHKNKGAGKKIFC